MKINSNNTSPNFKGSIYTSPMLKKGLEFASNNSALFCASTALVLSSVARPLAILATPNTDKENKKYAIAKSYASSITGYLLTALVATPVAKAVKNIDKNPNEYLSNQTIKNLQGENKTLVGSKKYQFATQLFKLGLGLFIAIPKSKSTSFLIPKVMNVLSKDKKNKEENNKEITFKGNIYDKGINKISKGISSIINSKGIQKLSEKMQNTNFERNFMYLTDVALTGAFIKETKKNKKIEEERKKPLIYNSLLSTIFSIVASFSVNKLIEKDYQKFVKKFIKENANSKKLNKYLEGLNIAKNSLIMGSIYYIIIPILSTFLSDKINKKQENI